MKPRQKRAIQSMPASPAYRDNFDSVFKPRRPWWDSLRDSFRLWKAKKELASRIAAQAIPPCGVGRHRDHVMESGRKVCLDCGRLE